MKSELEKIRHEALAALKKISSNAELEAFRVRYFGRKEGVLTRVMQSLGDLAEEERRILGQFSNEVKRTIEEALSETAADIESKSEAKAEWIDVTQPGATSPRGHLHITTRAIDEILRIFTPLGFVLRRYPEIDWDYYAFESLNMPTDHPARDEWETFFVDEPKGKKGQLVLTPHTSNGQTREMERALKEWGMPIRMTNISKCYRRQSDVSHVPMFHQFEGFAIDRGVNLTHLKGTIEHFVVQFFGPDRKARFRPFHFRFTEPSFEIDISCGLCDGTGISPPFKGGEGRGGERCRMCKSGWLELGGAGMVHPSVLRAGGVDPKEYSGFAFGWGVERTYLMKAGLRIDDIRVLYKNDLQFLHQF